ncbi:MAG: hypothetical protein M3044_04735 [Thermoproteota archaeon]|nr:hypothetical protein [Thermoproteota archaeon]
MSADPKVPDLTPIVEILKEFRILETIKSKLFARPDEGSKHLSAVLKKISKSYITLAENLRIFTTLTFDSEQQTRESKEFLFEAKFGYLTDESEDARASCSRILNIYNTCLSGWFFRLLKSDEANRLETLFRVKFSPYDKEFVLAVDRTNEFLTNSGELIYPLVVEGGLQQAQQKVKEFSNDLDLPLTDLRNELKIFLSMEADFLEKSKAV